VIFWAGAERPVRQGAVAAIPQILLGTHNQFISLSV